jgi:acid stress-induced BolA-like protein IbaG/YrbA
VISAHAGATEDYATLLATMRAEMAELNAGSEAHIDGGSCHFELAVVWHCAECGRQQHQIVADPLA